MSTTGTGNAAQTAWQEKLLPVMSGALRWSALFFFLASLIQLTYLQLRIASFAESRGKDFELRILDEPVAPEAIAAMEATAAIALEARALQYRHQRADVLLMARVWTRYLGFVTGMILAVVGAAFVLGRIESRSFTLKGGAGEAHASLEAASPGLALCSLGTVLMAITMLNHNVIEVRDAAIYTSSSGRETTPSSGGSAISILRPESIEPTKENQE